MAPQVPKDKAAEVAAAATADNLNRALASSGISVGAISSTSLDAAPDTETVTMAPVAAPSFGGLGIVGLAGVGAAVLVLLVAAAAGAYCCIRSRRAQQEQFTGAVRIPTRPAP